VGLLSLDRVCKNFAGLEVLRDVTVSVDSGERRAIIGPNGAGKTTLFNIISGELPASSGSITLADREVTGLPPERMFRLGVARTFQKNSLFLDLTTQENVRLAVQAHQRQGHHWLRPWWTFDEINLRTRQVLERAGLWSRRLEPAKNLSYGEQRQLEIGIRAEDELEGGRLALALGSGEAGRRMLLTSRSIVTHVDGVVKV